MPANATMTVATTIATLTPKERELFESVCAGMDQPGMGWLHELAEESLSTNAVLGSLIRKGLVYSEADAEPGMPCCYWVSLTPEAAAAAGIEV